MPAAAAGDADAMAGGAGSRGAARSAAAALLRRMRRQRRLCDRPDGAAWPAGTEPVTSGWRELKGLSVEAVEFGAAATATTADHATTQGDDQRERARERNSTTRDMVTHSYATRHEWELNTARVNKALSDCNDACQRLTRDQRRIPAQLPQRVTVRAPGPAAAARSAPRSGSRARAPPVLVSLTQDPARRRAGRAAAP